eukprot:TRINITY_DN11621_c0_g1_i3.p1 TRINITY_DN11621_c0_g1~~TRINITY_DN11621_c0_g1_i3.p1  ORF type:complete len:331 (-),score=55.47 TRINITY_DN11621_c0_g1_i3:115-1107(-)
MSVIFSPLFFFDRRNKYILDIFQNEINTPFFGKKKKKKKTRARLWYEAKRSAMSEAFWKSPIMEALSDMFEPISRRVIHLFRRLINLDSGGVLGTVKFLIILYLLAMCFLVTVAFLFVWISQIRKKALGAKFSSHLLNSDYSNREIIETLQYWASREAAKTLCHSPWISSRIGTPIQVDKMVEDVYVRLDMFSNDFRVATGATLRFVIKGPLGRIEVELYLDIFHLPNYAAMKIVRKGEDEHYLPRPNYHPIMIPSAIKANFGGKGEFVEVSDFFCTKNIFGGKDYFVDFSAMRESQSRFDLSTSLNPDYPALYEKELSEYQLQQLQQQQ